MRFLLFFLVSFFLFFVSFPVTASDFSQKVVAGYRITNAASVEKFYAEREGKLFWIEDGRLTSEAEDVLKAIAESWDQGLNPENYFYATLKRFADNGVPEGHDIESEILFTDAVMRFGSDLSGMRLSPRAAEEDPSSWSRGIDGYALMKILEQKSDPADFLSLLPPDDPIYNALRKEVRSLMKDIADRPEREPKIPVIGTLRPGHRYRIIPLLRSKLGDGGKSDIYDESLQRRVVAFQKENDLIPDGVIGARTFDAVNLTRREKLGRVIADMERRRWVRRPLPPRYVAVNIPQMKLQAVEEGDVRFEMPVIVGRLKRPTPSFVGKIEGVRFNPKWYVPDTIKVEDYLPKLRDNPNALDDHKINFRVKTEEGMKTVSSADINWATVTDDDLKNIQMYQDGGGDNALGVVRVLMPNRYDVYLHDTNAPELFAKNDRMLSSGCVRLSEPRRIAEFVLKYNPGWSADKMNAAIASGKLSEVKALHSLPVYLFYFTVWANEKGKVVVASDVYGEDAKLLDQLQKSGKLPFDDSMIH